MKKGAQVLLIVVVCLLIPSIVFAEDQISSTEAYLEDLHSQGNERVIVIFNDDAEVDPTLVDKYNGNLIRVFTTIKALVCEIPQGNIDLLGQEESVKEVAPDIAIEAQPAGQERDPLELAEFLRLKEEYLQKIETEYSLAVKLARDEYIKFMQVELAEKRRIILLYRNFLEYLKEKGYTDTFLYKYILARYSQLLEEYYIAWREAFSTYLAKIMAARDVYVTATGEWKERVNEMLAASYDGTVTVRWNNMEAGLNSQAGWDNYNLDGTGIKIAFIDSGVNYTMENLDGNYLGGYDFVSDDNNPINENTDETHGTEIASLAVGEGVNKVVGVAYNASYYAIRVADGSGTGLVSNAIAGIEWASTEPHKADIISMSLGVYDVDQAGNPLWPSIREAFENMCNNAYNAGVVLVAGSGNRGYNYSAYPAAFADVVSVGGHAEDQTLYTDSNGGVDIIAPGARVYTVEPDNSAWWCWGTSYATPHAAALIALQMQHARDRNIEVNNGYLWESMKHSAVNLGLNPVYQGVGKIWAAETTPPPANGSIDIMSSSIWPFDYTFEYFNYYFTTPEGYPIYHIGRTMSQEITLTNITDTVGNDPVIIDNLTVTTTQKYQDTGDTLPGDAIEVFSPISSFSSGTVVPLPDDYPIPLTARPGLYDVVLDLQFELAGNPRVLKICDNKASTWCPPEPEDDQTGYGQTGYGQSGYGAY